MKRITACHLAVFCLLAFFATASQAAIHYVRPFVQGAANGDGSSYANAWIGLRNIDWNNLNAGDTLMVCDKHISDKNPVVGDPGSTVDTRSKQVVLGIAKSGITVDGSCDGNPGTIYSGAPVSIGKLHNWIPSVTDPGVYETAFNNGYPNDILCEDGVALIPHTNGSPWMAGQYERRWAGGSGTVYYKPTAGVPTAHRTTLHRWTSTGDCAEVRTGNGGTWDQNFTTWHDADQDGIYELKILQYLFDKYLLETDTSANNEMLLTWNRATTGNGGTQPDPAWGAGSFSYYNDPADPYQNILYYRPSAGTPADRNLYAPTYTVIAVFDASGVTVRNLDLFGGGGGEIHAYNAQGLTIESNVLQWGGHAVFIADNSDGGSIIGNEIANIGCGSGIYFSSTVGQGVGNPNAGSCDDWTIKGNHIHDVSQVADKCVISLDGAGRYWTQVDRHSIGIENGNRLLIEDNHIHNAGGEGVALYNWSRDGRAEQKDNVIRRNYIHDIEDLAFGPGGCLKVGDSSVPPPFPRCHNERGIDLGGDNVIPRPELSTGNQVYQNLLENIGTLAFRFKSPWSSDPQIGHTWKIFNNIVVNTLQGRQVITGTGLQSPNNGGSYTATYGAYYANNIFLDTGAASTVFIPTEGVTPATFSSNNIFYNTSGTAPQFTIGTAPGYSLADWQSQTGLDLDAMTGDPLLLPVTAGEYRLADTSPAIDAGAANNISADKSGNPIYGVPDIGAFELQPPFMMGMDPVDPAANIRIYGDGKFRNTAAPAGSVANLVLTPQGGYASGDNAQFSDLSVSLWETAGLFGKQWNSTTVDPVTVQYQVGDLEPGSGYVVQVDASDYTSIVSGASGSSMFSYSHTDTSTGHAFVVTSASVGVDTDSDGLSDAFEWCFDGNCAGYNPYHPIINPTGTDLNSGNPDTDGDGYSDIGEIANGADPADPSSVPAITPDGDVNLDGNVDVADLLVVHRYLSGLDTLTEEQIAHGDYYPAAGNGQITISDLLLINRVVLDVN